MAIYFTGVNGVEVFFAIAVSYYWTERFAPISAFTLMERDCRPIYLPLRKRVKVRQAGVWRAFYLPLWAVGLAHRAQTATAKKECAD